MSESRTITVTMSFPGIMANASDGVSEFDDIVGECPYDDEYKDVLENSIGNIKTCLSAYHDTILGLLKGDVTLDEARDFWFRGDAEAISKLAYKGDILKIGAKE